MEPTVTHHEIISRLLALPAEIEVAAALGSSAETARRHLEEQVVLTEDRLLLAGAIDGKNEAIRAAQLREGTADTRAYLEEVQQVVAAKKLVLQRLQNEHASLRAIARLLGGNNE